MNFLIIIFYIFLLVELLMAVITPARRIHYSAIFYDLEPSYLYELYQKESDSGPPSPSLDLATTDPSIRLQICDEVSRSGVFTLFRKSPVEMEDVYHELQQPQYSDIFHHIYSPAESRSTSPMYEYDNPYKLLKLKVYRSSSPHRVSTNTDEYVFVCLLKRTDNGEHSSSKPSGSENSDGEDFSEEDSAWEIEEENSNSSENHHLSGTEEEFDEISGGATINDDVNIDEGSYTGNSADMDDLSGFLETIGSRQDIDSMDFYDADEENSTEFDPSVTVDDDHSRSDHDPNDIVPFYVSKIYNAHRGLGAHRFVFTKERCHSVMLAEEPAKVYSRPDFNVELHYLELRKHYQSVLRCDDDPVCTLRKNSQSHRLCTIVLASSFFKGKITYPFEGQQNAWFIRKVTFKTEEGLAKAAGRSYSEVMVRCYAKMVDGGREQTFHISRAYRPNEVFVYSQEGLDGISNTLHLEALSTHVGIVHERYNFNEVEI